jgi:hypothetical protein
MWGGFDSLLLPLCLFWCAHIGFKSVCGLIWFCRGGGRYSAVEVVDMGFPICEIGKCTQFPKLNDFIWCIFMLGWFLYVWHVTLYSGFVLFVFTDPVGPMGPGPRPTVGRTDRTEGTSLFQLKLSSARPHLIYRARLSNKENKSAWDPSDQLRAPQSGTWLWARSGTWHDQVPGTIWYLARPGRSGTWHDQIWYLARSDNYLID